MLKVIIRGEIAHEFIKYSFNDANTANEYIVVRLNKIFLERMERMVRKWIYATLSIVGLVVLFLVDLTMAVPFATNQIVVSVLLFSFYLYLLYLIIFRKVY